MSFTCWVNSSIARAPEKRRSYRSQSRLPGRQSAHIFARPRRRRRKTRCRFFQKSDRRVCLPRSIHLQIEQISRRNAPKRSAADLPLGNFAVRARARVPDRPRQSPQRRRCDSLSSAAGFYRQPDLMQTTQTKIVAVVFRWMRLREATPINCSQALMDGH